MKGFNIFFSHIDLSTFFLLKSTKMSWSSNSWHGQSSRSFQDAFINIITVDPSRNFVRYARWECGPSVQMSKLRLIRAKKPSHHVSAFYLLHSWAVCRCANRKLAGRGEGLTTLESQLQGWRWGCGLAAEVRGAGVEQPKPVSRGTLSDSLGGAHSTSLLSGLEEDSLRCSGSSNDHAKPNPSFGLCKRKTYLFDPRLFSHRIPAGKSLSECFPC